jgi:hypothetical protein
MIIFMAFSVCLESDLNVSSPHRWMLFILHPSRKERRSSLNILDFFPMFSCSFHPYINYLPLAAMMLLNLTSAGLSLSLNSTYLFNDLAGVINVSTILEINSIRILITITYVVGMVSTSKSESTFNRYHYR